MGKGISVVIPVYNSSNSLEELYLRLSRILKKISDCYEIIMVDDGSKDNSYKVMLGIHSRDHRVKVIKLNRNYGQQNALLCGFNFVRYEYTITLDDDLQHLPGEMVKLLKPLEEGYDIVFGIPGVKQHSFYRKIGSKLTDYLFNKITAKPPALKVSSFRAIRRELLEKIKSHNKSFIYISASALIYTKNAANVEVEHGERLHGSSNYSFRKLTGLFLKLWIYYSDSPLLGRLTSAEPPYSIEEVKL